MELKKNIKKALNIEWDESSSLESFDGEEIKKMKRYLALMEIEDALGSSDSSS